MITGKWKTGMRNFLALCLALSLGGASLGPALAQDTTAPTETDAEAPAEAAPDAGETPPQETVAAVHGDWQIRCDASEACFMYQQAIDSRDIPIAEMTVVTRSADDGPTVMIMFSTPLQTLLPRKLQLQVDNGRLNAYDFAWCDQVGCHVRLRTDDAGIQDFRKGNKARITVYSITQPESPYVLDISLSGFTAAYNDLKAR